MNDIHFSSRMLAGSGVLMIIAGIFFASCVKIAYGGLLFAAALCILFAARSFRIAEDKDVHKHRNSKKNPENQKIP